MSKIQKEVDQIVKEVNDKYIAEQEKYQQELTKMQKNSRRIRKAFFFCVPACYLTLSLVYAYAYALQFEWQMRLTSEARSILGLIHSPFALFVFHVLSFLIAYETLDIARDLWDISRKTKLADLSHEYLALLAILVGLVIATFTYTTSFFLVIPHLLLTFCYLSYGYIFFSSEERDKRHEKDIQDANNKLKDVFDNATEEDIAETWEMKHCDICSQESKYDICMDCEVKYRGERHRVRAQVLRAKQNGTDATLTLREWLDILNAFHWNCAYCQHEPFTDMEHYVPISQGGGTTAENCIPSCKSCNSKKSDKHPEQDHHSYKPFQVSVSPKSGKNTTKKGGK